MVCPVCPRFVVLVLEVGREWALAMGLVLEWTFVGLKKFGAKITIALLNREGLGEIFFGY